MPGNEPQAGQALEQALDQLEQGLQAAVEAIAQIRDALAPAAPLVRPGEPPALRVVPKFVMPEPKAEAPEPKAEIMDPPVRASDPSALDSGAPALRERGDDPYTPFERLWERMEVERVEKQRHALDGEPERHGLDLLPQMYMVTVEDRERHVDLVPLHRALLGIEGIEEISLASYANGVPVVSLRANRAIDMDQLRAAVESTLRRSCELIPQDTGRIFLRLTTQDKIGV